MEGKDKLVHYALYILCVLLVLLLIFKIWDCSKIDPSLIVALLSLGVSIFTIAVAFHLYADWKKPYTQQSYRDTTLAIINCMDSLDLEILEVAHIRDENNNPLPNENKEEYKKRVTRLLDHQNNIVTRATLDLEYKIEIFKEIRNDTKSKDFYDQYMELHKNIMDLYDTLGNRSFDEFYASEELMWKSFSKFKSDNRKYLFDILKENHS